MLTRPNIELFNDEDILTLQVWLVTFERELPLLDSVHTSLSYHENMQRVKLRFLSSLSSLRSNRLQEALSILGAIMALPYCEYMARFE
jgi:hypothetical protein